MDRRQNALDIGSHVVTLIEGMLRHAIETIDVGGDLKVRHTRWLALGKL
jgi:hypothetical protein